MSSDYTELDAYIQNLNLEYSARFIPQNESRNKDQKDPSLNWKITLKRRGPVLSGEILETDYMQGIGHVPDYQKLKAKGYHPENAAITGTYTVGPVHVRLAKVPEPTLRDVLHSLVSDADVLESSGFEDWASNLGYDTDSRKAEAIYRACLEIALKLKALIGQDKLDKLRELYQDY